MSRTPQTKHLRYGRYPRLRRSKHFLAWLADRAADLAATGAAITPVLTTPATGLFTLATHGLGVGDGPFYLTAATTLPSGAVAGETYYVKSVPDADTFTLCSSRGGAVAAFGDAGTGTLTLTKGDDAVAIYEYLKKNPVAVVAAATDADDL